MTEPSRERLRSYRDLLVWQRSMDLVIECYAVARLFPPMERYALADQLRRAVVSVPANIAEGYGRAHRAEYLQYLAIARGSLMETETHLSIAHRLMYVGDAQLAKAERASTKTGQLLARLMAGLKRSKS